jgi:hypothetical protein
LFQLCAAAAHCARGSSAADNDDAAGEAEVAAWRLARGGARAYHYTRQGGVFEGMLRDVDDLDKVCVWSDLSDRACDVACRDDRLSINRLLGNLSLRSSAWATIYLR